MNVQQGLDGKPKEFFFGDGKQQRKARTIQDPDKEVIMRLGHND